MLYHLLTGERPFGQPTTVRGLRERLYVEPRAPRAIRPEVPAWLQEVILRCLEVDPAKRHPSAAQLALDLREPQGVQLTERAERLQSKGLLSRARRWFASIGAEPLTAGQSGQAGSQVARSPITMAAVDVDNATPALLEALRDAVRRSVLTAPGARLACVGVMRTARIGLDELTDDAGRSLHVKQLVALQHWARPLATELGLADGRLTFHVLEAPDVAEALVDFANKCEVDHIVMGARSGSSLSSLRRALGSVSSQVLATSDCTVTMVREKL